MGNSDRLRYLSYKSSELIRRLWDSCFEGNENMEYINRFSPSPQQSYYELEKYLKSRHNYFTWVIQNKETNELIGYLVLGGFYPGQTNMVSVHIGLPFTGKGFGTEALQWLITFAKESHYRFLTGVTAEENYPALKIMQKNGFAHFSRTGKAVNGNLEVKLKREL